MNFFPEQTNKLNEFFCPNLSNGKPNFRADICNALISIICGFNKQEQQLDRRILTNFLKYYSHSVSLKEFLHLFQHYKKDNFTMFDYGRQNFKVYGSKTPPNYPLENIKAPVFIYAGSCDAIISEIDLKHLSEALPNVKKFKVLENYNHCDFVFGKNSKKFLFNGIIRSMQKSLLRIN